MPRDNSIWRRQRDAQRQARTASAPAVRIPLRLDNSPPPSAAAELQRNSERAEAIKQFWHEVKNLEVEARRRGDDGAVVAVETPGASGGSLLAQLVRPAVAQPSLVRRLNGLRNGEAKAPADGALQELLEDS